MYYITVILTTLVERSLNAQLIESKWNQNKKLSYRWQTAWRI